MITSKFGRYEIKNEIAKGGMATVFHAYDPNFERDVALKVLPQAFLHDPQFRVRFEREAKMIARLEHPAIVPVYDFGEEEGQPFIVMRYMSGGDLTERIEQGQLPLTESARIVTRIAQALDAAHSRSIIHRDLKPGNVLFDQYGNGFLSDFGIARVAAEEGGQTLTGTSILGTPSYMSPEQVQGEKNIDGRSDIYSLGVMVFQMLSGQLPFQGETPAKVMMMHVLQSAPNILDVKPDLPPHCEALVRKAMAKDPADRFATASELAQALDSIARGEPLPSLFSMTETVVAKGGQLGLGAEMVQVARPGGVRPAISVPAAETQVARQPRSRMLSVGLPLILVIGLLGAAIGGLFILGKQGKGPLAMLAPTATFTPQPSATLALPTDTPLLATPTAGAPTQEPGGLIESPTLAFTDTPTSIPPTPTETPVPTPAVTIIGGADKIAFLDKSDIYVANLDGTGVKRLTEDGTAKTSMQWSFDGQSINYISGKCVQTVNIESGKIDILTCFNFVEYLKSFMISPDGTHVAISLDNQLYLVPYDIERLSQAKLRNDLTAMAPCKDFAPYLRNFVKYMYWSKDSRALAMVIMGQASGVGSADIIQVIPVTACTPTPSPLDSFPPPRFRWLEYNESPMIPTFSWDGLVLFAMHSYIRNNGFGDLYIYNMDLHKAQMKVNPVKNTCCYRDTAWSPDGAYLLFTYQSYSAGPTSPVSIYMIQYGSLGTSATYEPLSLPPIDGNNPTPMPILRPAQ